MISLSAQRTRSAPLVFNSGSYGWAGTRFVQVDRAQRTLKSRVVRVVALVKPCIEGDVDHGILLRVIKALDTKGLEQKRLGFLKDLLRRG